jgi:enoyl-CoA hydratase/carnithine racemase
MPTIAWVNGHAFAGGLMLAMYHDYRVFNASRGFLCLNELEFGAPLKPPMSSIFRQKLPSPQVYRSMVLEAKRFGAQEALEGGIVDALGGLDEVLALIAEKKLVDKPKSGVYGLLKKEMYRETLGYLNGFGESEKENEDFRIKEEKRKEEAKSKIAEWERNVGGSKL